MVGGWGIGWTDRPLAIRKMRKGILFKWPLSEGWIPIEDTAPKSLSDGAADAISLIYA